MANIERTITRKAFHFNNSELNEFELRKLLDKETDHKIDIYDYHVLDGDSKNLSVEESRILNQLPEKHKKILVIVEYSKNNEGMRENIIHHIPFNSWIVQMVDNSWEVMKHPVIKDFFYN